MGASDNLVQVTGLIDISNLHIGTSGTGVGVVL
jgi:hypothetical protein